MQALQQQPIIRPAALRDLPSLGQIWLELMGLHQERDRHFTLAGDALPRWMRMAEEMLGRNDAFLFKAEVDGRCVGLCLGWVATNPPIYDVREVGFISEVAVLRSAQRRGIGTALIAQARRWFAAQDLHEFQLSTAVWNEAACRFWESVGGKPLLVRYRFDTD
jgi:ribosomal protein S18 acetylase RimI-like enzyme